MFWNKKTKLPITKEDKVWVDEDLIWLRTEFGEEHFMEIRTVTPTKDFYDRTFDGTEKDAEFILKRTMELMNIRETEIKLEFFSDQPIEMADGTILTTPADINGSWKSASGTYQQTKKETLISIERGQLKNPVSLIATISHELSHQILLGENRIEENDEFLTDFTAITYGFGIFIGNSRFQFSSQGFGWQSSSQGYLPEQIIAYAMAWLSNERNEKRDYSQFLDKSLKKYFDQSLDWLIENEK
ncbi:hypothetical protein ULMS_29560 [Patiriisocius marinistellae]|uniref:Uncharacterized protein n=1 Tax=Patiriisocius marinistellae TaxID=2494560 RepID=A0A5J4G0Z1_9FLAO|nr:hypothetical protein [Patiriisocius marinistellae]GEQ87448.1 hypothetical protein ULMS_29560 [Patiriisocius marinistellae]